MYGIDGLKTKIEQKIACKNNRSEKLCRSFLKNKKNNK